MYFRRTQGLCREFVRRISINSVLTSTTHRGTAFEERSLKILQDNLCMSLQRVGGREDGGIDLQGWWWLPEVPSESSKESVISGHVEQPEFRRRLRVLAQCKAEKKKASPKYVRELEGVMLRYIALSPRTNDDLSQKALSMSSSEDLPKLSHYPLVALLVSESPFTKSTLLRAHSSPLPFLLLHIPPLPETREKVSPDVGEVNQELVRQSPDENNGIGSAFWNPALAGSRGVLGAEMEIRWERSLDGECGRPSMWWRNRKLKSWIPGGRFLTYNVAQ
ncbi:hypothetical protein AX17_004730 [Amanita inopinata Kibby_2008]|nr:hypothetical protein AX17_004730 [Amanita inopinata Kibby_2008]